MASQSSERPIRAQPRVPAVRGFPRYSAKAGLVDHGSFRTSEGGTSTASFLHSTFLQAISTVMLLLLPVHVSQGSGHLCLAKLKTSCDVCFVGQSVHPSIDFGVMRAVDPQLCLQPKTVHGCVPVRAAHPSLHCWLIGCLTSQQHASVSQGRICSDNFTCCHTEIESCRSNFLPHPVTAY